jgi:hypothetical protein
MQPVKHLMKVGFEPGDGCWIDTIANGIALYISLNEPGRFKFAQVLGDGRLSERQFGYQITANAAVYSEQVFEYGNPGRVTDGFGQCSHFIYFIAKQRTFTYTHLLKYYIAILR